MRIKLSVAEVARYAALLAAMAISYSVERDLALTHGVPHGVCFAVPVAIDLYLVWAVRTRRDVALAVTVATLANVGGVLTTENLHAVSTWVSAALHAAFPLMCWRMHRRPDSAIEPISGASANVEPLDSGNGPQNGSPALAGDVWEEFEGTLGPAPVEPSGRLDDSKARTVAAECKQRGMSARKAAPLVTRSHVWVSRVYRELAPAV